jgi:FixJ family two-component response regulator
LPRTPDDQRVRLSGDGRFPALRLQDFAYLAGSYSVSGPLVAIIDDDEELGWSLVDLMRSDGYRAEPYTSAETFLTSSNLFSSDCIVADVDMPGMTGLNLLRKLHEQGITTPVILITALPHRHLNDEATSLGAQCLLGKPFETTALLDWVERSLSNEPPAR